MCTDIFDLDLAELLCSSQITYTTSKSTHTWLHLPTEAHPLFSDYRIESDAPRSTQKDVLEISCSAT